MTLHLGLLGWPVGHSRSPAMHAAALRARDLAGHYAAYAVRPARLEAAIAGARALGFRGLNLTVPHKEAALAFVDVLDGPARATGAVNTLVFEEEGTTRGLNTDAPGLVRALEEARVPLRGARVVVLGAGGAARAAVVGLKGAGAAAIRVHARRPAQAEGLGRDLGVDAGSLEGLSLEGVTLVVQATSAALDAASGRAFAARLPLEQTARDATVVDLVYAPRPTAVLAVAASAGRRTVDGLGMLLHQGALAFEAWTGHPAPLPPMRLALGDGPDKPN